MSRSTFNKYLKIGNQYKVPFRLTDLCDYCEWAKKTKNNIKAFFESLSYDIGENLGPNELINCLMIKKK